jgi:hypothetical protein
MKASLMVSRQIGLFLCVTQNWDENNAATTANQGSSAE